jgi:hypothetical protein
VKGSCEYLEHRTIATYRDFKGKLHAFISSALEDQLTLGGGGSKFTIPSGRKQVAPSGPVCVATRKIIQVGQPLIYCTLWSRISYPPLQFLDIFSGPRPPHCTDFRIRHTTVGRIPLDEWSVRRRHLYLTTQNTHRRHTCPQRVSNLQSQKASGCRLRLSKARPRGSTLCFYGTFFFWQLPCGISAATPPRFVAVDFAVH